MNRKALGTAFVAGFLFSLGLGISGMTVPAKIVGFLDIFGNWDPSLAGVMGGGILVALLMYRRVVAKGQPFFASGFQIPTRTDITPSLVIGGGMFGMGWGIAGFCPGPAVTSLVTGSKDILVFVGAMLMGMLIFRVVEPALTRRNVAKQELADGAGQA